MEPVECALEFPHIRVNPLTDELRNFNRENDAVVLRFFNRNGNPSLIIRRLQVDGNPGNKSGAQPVFKTDGVRSIATALRDRRGRAVAAINVSTHAGRVSLRELRTTFIPALLETAAEINARLAKR